MLRRVTLAAVLLISALAAALPAQAQTSCQFVLGFKDLHDLAPDAVGECKDNQQTQPNGDAQQHTAKGLMAWRKADNLTVFTDGYMTWINGPQGLQSRLNTEKFDWEAAPSGPNRLTLNGLTAAYPAGWAVTNFGGNTAILGQLTCCVVVVLTLNMPVPAGITTLSDDMIKAGTTRLAADASITGQQNLQFRGAKAALVDLIKNTYYYRMLTWVESGKLWILMLGSESLDPTAVGQAQAALTSIASTVELAP